MDSNKKPCVWVSEWASLPLPAIFLILNKLFEQIDHVRFAVVCKDWRSLSKEYNQATQRWRNILPMLLIPSECHDKSSLTTRKLVYSISQGKILDEHKLRVLFRKRCCGSSHGWVATIEYQTDEGLIIALRNSFRKAWSIYLPPLDAKVPEGNTGYHEFYIPKVVLSSDPALDPKNCVVAAICGSNCILAFTKRGQTHWTYIKRKFFLFDVIFHKGHACTVGTLRTIVSWDVTSLDCNPLGPPKAKILSHRNRSYQDHKAYLVELTNEDLLYVRRLYEATIDGPTKSVYFRTTGFRVYKCVFNHPDGTIADYVEVKSIGNETLFVGDNHSLSILASNIPTCRPNSIYFTDDLAPSFRGFEISDGTRPSDDMGIFNLEDGTITQHYSLDSRLRGYIPPAIWVVPPFDGLC
ncbi:putative F-box protein At1g65770 [Pyrus x bretschneideri]|uniref:putative F-box protein At1g65770 n=1 Tax=Pyrus x bretschneideri TaxID=225117 RepID=UPI00202ECB59|nr:putative F-box protein At1g65770 [Pyrus x bretschneideri]